MNCASRPYRGYLMEIVCSPDDDGWYVTVLNRRGQEEYQTELHPTEIAACTDAFRWVDEHADED